MKHKAPEFAPIQEHAPNALTLDLAKKLTDDFYSLLNRHLSIMVPSIGTMHTVDIVMSMLAMTGFSLEDSISTVADGAFMSIVRTVERRRAERK